MKGLVGRQSVIDCERNESFWTTNSLNHISLVRIVGFHRIKVVILTENIKKESWKK